MRLIGSNYELTLVSGFIACRSADKSSCKLKNTCLCRPSSSLNRTASRANMFFGVCCHRHKTRFDNTFKRVFGISKITEPIGALLSVCRHHPATSFLWIFLQPNPKTKMISQTRISESSVNIPQGILLCQSHVIVLISTSLRFLIIGVELNPSIAPCKPLAICWIWKTHCPTGSSESRTTFHFFVVFRQADDAELFSLTAFA